MLLVVGDQWRAFLQKKILDHKHIGKESKLMKKALSITDVNGMRECVYVLCQVCFVERTLQITMMDTVYLLRHVLWCCPSKKLMFMGAYDKNW